MELGMAVLAGLVAFGAFKGFQKCRVKRLCTEHSRKAIQATHVSEAERVKEEEIKRRQVKQRRKEHREKVARFHQETTEQLTMLNSLIVPNACELEVKYPSAKNYRGYTR